MREFFQITPDLWQVQHMFGKPLVVMSGEEGTVIGTPEPGREYWIEIAFQQFDAWRRGCPVQLAFPELSVIDREFLLSGLTPTEQKELFG